MSDQAPKKPGIVDPWRKVDPLRPAPPRPAPPAHEKIDIQDVDKDADMRVPGRYVIRSPHACFDVTSHRVVNPGDAVEVLADCLIALSGVAPVAQMLAAAGVGVRRGDRAWNVPDDAEPSSTLEGGAAKLWFAQKPSAEGMLVLARILREPAAAHALHEHGVTVMIAV